MTTTKKKKLIPKVTSFYDLRTRAEKDPRYVTLAVKAASNLGGAVKDGDFEGAMRWLNVNAMETESGERGVIGEVNFMRSCVDA